MNERQSTGDKYKPILSEPTMNPSLLHIGVARPHWVKYTLSFARHPERNHADYGPVMWNCGLFVVVIMNKLKKKPPNMRFARDSRHCAWRLKCYRRYAFHYGDITWASWRLNSSATRVFVLQFVRAYIKVTPMFRYWPKFAGENTALSFERLQVP